MTSFIDILIDTWQQGIQGFGIGEIVICLVILVLSLILRSLVSTKIIDWISLQADKTDSLLDNKIIESLRNPIGLIPLALGFYLITFYLPLEGTVDFVATNFVKMLVIFTIFSAFDGFSSELSRTTDGRTDREQGKEGPSTICPYETVH